jgi:hypothetical protein
MIQSAIFISLAAVCLSVLLIMGVSPWLSVFLAAIAVIGQLTIGVQERELETNRRTIEIQKRTITKQQKTIDIYINR